MYHPLGHRNSPACLMAGLLSEGKTNEWSANKCIRYFKTLVKLNLGAGIFSVFGQNELAPEMKMKLEPHLFLQFILS